MTNADVAAILNEIADLMEVSGENDFKVRSYRRVVEAVENLAEDIAGLHQRGALQTIPGVGRGLAEKIAEYHEAGKA